MNDTGYDDELQQEKISYLEDRITLEQEEKTVYRNLLEKLLEGFSNPDIPHIVRELHTVSLEQVDLKIDSDKMKVKKNFISKKIFEKIFFNKKTRQN